MLIHIESSVLVLFSLLLYLFNLPLVSGHYMVLNSALARNASTSTITFHHFIPNNTEPSYFLFYYYIVPKVRVTPAATIRVQPSDNIGTLKYKLSTETEVISEGLLEPRLGRQIWYSACINNPPKTLEAVSLDVTGQDTYAALDDVSFNPGHCLGKHVYTIVAINEDKSILVYINEIFIQLLLVI